MVVEVVVEVLEREEDDLGGQEVVGGGAVHEVGVLEQGGLRQLDGIVLESEEGGLFRLLLWKLSAAAAAGLKISFFIPNVNQAHDASCKKKEMRGFKKKYFGI